jgi:hypothetical protein
LPELGDHPLQQAGGNDFAAPQRHRRSMISATATIDASSKGQIGQPAA